jgi:hypothetical protein
MNSDNRTMWFVSDGEDQYAALKVLHYALETKGFKGERLADHNNMFVFAWTMHEDFQKEFLDKVPEHMKIVPLVQVKRWIDTYPHTIHKTEVQ